MRGITARISAGDGKLSEGCVGICEVESAAMTTRLKFRPSESRLIRAVHVKKRTFSPKEIVGVQGGLGGGLYAPSARERRPKKQLVLNEIGQTPSV